MQKTAVRVTEYRAVEYSAVDWFRKSK